MSDFKAKMHQIRFPLGLRASDPDPAGGSLQRSSEPLDVVFKGPTSKGMKGRGKGRGGKEKGR